MSQFETAPEGTFALELDDGSSDVTIPDSPGRVSSSSVETISSTTSSESEVVTVRFWLLHSEEIERMKNEERAGHYCRVVELGCLAGYGRKRVYFSVFP